MRIIVQRVKYATVKVNHKIVGKINIGFLILLGIENDDNEQDAEWLCNKIVNMRIFNDENQKMNLSIKDVDGNILLISQFTLHASTKKGNRPSFIKAAKPDVATPLYNYCNNKLSQLLNKKIESGIFGADMKVELLNDGPVTIFIDSKNKE